MENFQRVFILAVVILSVVGRKVNSQKYTSSGGQGQWEECGIQDKDELPDMHAAAPWAAALFYVEGDIFQNQLKPQYLNTAIFITKNLAVTSGSKILAQQELEQQTKLQLYYGHRASGKQTLIRVRKVESLNPSRPPQPLALKVDTSALSRNLQTSRQSHTSKSPPKAEGHSDLYLLHLESSVEISSFSRPICLKKDIFPYKNSYYDIGRSLNKVHVSGYASKNDKNETNGPVVVYFSGDREWRVQDWDSDFIYIKTREQQVSYGFLPKDFNPGSAFTVKIGSNFYLAGILMRSNDSLTTIRSLEPFVDMIMAKGAASHRPAFEQPPNLSDQDYHSGQDDHEVQYARPAAPSQYPLNPGFQSSGSVLQTDFNKNSKPIRNTYQPDSRTQEQITYLKEVEERETEDHGYGSVASQGNHFSLGRPSTTATSTSRYDSHFERSTQPALSSRPQSTQNQQQIHQGFGPSIVAPILSQNNVGRSSTTQRSSLPSQFPQETFHSQPQQQSVKPRPDKSRNPSQSPISTQQQSNIRCSHDFLEGVDIECLSRQRGVSTTECIKNAPSRSRIRLSCKPHYIPLDGDKLIEKTCDSSGNWLPRKAFACKLDCGNVERSVPYIVHGSKTESEKWPWHAALFKKVNGTSYTYICGATLITRSILVTAAHCVYNSVDHTLSTDTFKVVIGAISSDLLSNRKDPQAQEFNIKEIKVNEHYNPRTFEADIALLQIGKPVLLTEYVRPVCFPYPSDENKQVSSYQLSEGNSGVVVGFGTAEDWAISKTLRMAALPVVSVKDCTNVLERLPSSSQYCAGYTNGTSVCEGDSGGAQIFKDQISKRYFVQGIISHGNRKESGSASSRCDHEKYTVFTKVGSFAEWVKEAVYDLEYDYNRRRRRRK